MKSEFAAAREFLRGAARFDDLLYVLAKGKAVMAKGIAHTSVIAVDQGKWGDVGNTTWDSAAIAVARAPTEKLVAVGEDGDVLTYVGGKKSKEQLKPAPVTIRNAHTIAGLVYACGMKRQVYVRLDEGSWKQMNAPAPKGKEKAGFEAIDGYSASELYAVGWSGEVWQFDGSAWTNRSSPTNVILTAVCCAPLGVVYAAGQQGVLLRGRRDAWEIVALDDEFDADIWDMCWFQDKLYVATMQALFTLDGSKMTLVDPGETEINTYYSLTTAGKVLWSVGKDDIASFDGKSWQRYD